MKRIERLIALALCGLVLVMSCSKHDNDAEVIAVTGVSLDKSDLRLAVGETTALTATTAPENATNKKVSWSSGNPSVATVDQNGKVTAAGSGTTVITVTTEDGGKTANCNVTIYRSNTENHKVEDPGWEWK